MRSIYCRRTEPRTVINSKKFSLFYLYDTFEKGKPVFNNNHSLSYSFYRSITVTISYWCFLDFYLRGHCGYQTATTVSVLMFCPAVDLQNLFLKRHDLYPFVCDRTDLRGIRSLFPRSKWRFGQNSLESLSLGNFFVVFLYTFVRPETQKTPKDRHFSLTFVMIHMYMSLRSEL